MLRLALDYNDGVCRLPCPVCQRFLVLAVEKMGRLLVVYDRSMRIPPGRRAMLICPDYNCDYREDVELVRTADDAVAYDPGQAAWYYQRERPYYNWTLGEVVAEANRLIHLCRETGNPKLPSAIHVWKQHCQLMKLEIWGDVRQSCEEGTEIHCVGKGIDAIGRVTAVMHDAFLLERTSDGETMLVSAGDLRSAYRYIPLNIPRSKLDFSEGPDERLRGVRAQQTLAQRYVEVEGHPLVLESVNRHGGCRVSTKDPEVARALGFWTPHLESYYGEFPRAMVDRCYRVIRYATVKGHRLHVEEATTDPAVFKVGTRQLETARALKMHYCQWHWMGQRRALRWWQFFHLDDMERWEELQIPVRLPWPRRR